MTENGRDLTRRVAKAIRQAVSDNNIDDHALYMMGDLTDDWRGKEAARIIAEAVVKELVKEEIATIQHHLNIAFGLLTLINDYVPIIASAVNHIEEALSTLPTDGE